MEPIRFPSARTHACFISRSHVPSGGSPATANALLIIHKQLNAVNTFYGQPVHKSLKQKRVAL